MRAAVELADELDAAALIIPSATGGGARAARSTAGARPIIALAHQPGVAEKLTLEWGVYPTMMPTADSVDDMIDARAGHRARLRGAGAGRARRPHRGAAHRHAGRHEPRDGPRDPRRSRARGHGTPHEPTPPPNRAHAATALRRAGPAASSARLDRPPRSSPPCRAAALS